MSSKQIDTYKKKILQPLAIIRAILIAFLVIGVFCILAAGIMIFYAKKGQGRESHSRPSRIGRAPLIKTFAQRSGKKIK